MTMRAFLMAAALANPGPPAGSVGTLDGVLKGQRFATHGELQDVRIVRYGKELPAKPGMSLERGDRVVTGPGVSAVVSLAAGYQLILEPSTDVEIQNPSLLMKVGHMLVRTTQQVREALKLKTSFAVAGVEGTQFGVALTENELVLAVAAGAVTLDPANGRDWPREVYKAPEGARKTRGERPPQRLSMALPQVEAIRGKFREVDRLIRRQPPMPR